ncbi:hypothetical protein ACFE04_007646 [Oxalis oulophora]
MGRPPCCDKKGVKKGPWTPEEDIILVSYIQEHGPGNWRSIPINTAIASYLPERTDNDIKNYWNTHLKKKLKKLDDQQIQYSSSNISHSISRGQWERRLQTDIHTAKQALSDALSPQLKNPNAQSTSYASSTENIAKLLKGWMRNSSKNISATDSGDSSSKGDEYNINNINNGEVNFDSSTYSPDFSNDQQSDEASVFQDEAKPNIVNINNNPDDGDGDGDGDQMPLSLLEKWLFDDSVGGKDNYNYANDDFTLLDDLTTNFF